MGLRSARGKAYLDLEEEDGRTGEAVGIDPSEAWDLQNLLIRLRDGFISFTDTWEIAENILIKDTKSILIHRDP